MNTYNLIKISLKAMRKNILRTFLTMLGIIIGVASVIAMLAIGQGSKDSIESSISALGANMIMIFPGSFRMGGVQMGAGTSPPLEVTDVDAIAAGCPSVEWVSPVVNARAQLIAGSSNWSSLVMGVYANYLNIRDMHIASGRNFTQSEAARGTKVCVLGKTVVNELFGEFADPVGQSIRINKVPFRIIGVLEGKGASMMGNDQDDVVLAPFVAVQRRLLGITDVQQIFASAYSEAVSDQATAEIRTVLDRRLPARSGEDAYTIRTMSELSSMLDTTSSVLVILLASVAGISLIVGGIGIMNIMYVTVTERTREIGLRMAVGARSRSILWQFLTEALVISLVGGLLGVSAGIAISLLFGRIMDWPVSITFFSIFLAFGFSSLIGIFFGWYPARKAANLMPIEALRYE